MLDYFELMQGFFIVTTVLFAVVAMAFLNRSKHLKRKLSAMLAEMAAKNKELETAKAAAQNVLSPFIPETSRSIIVSVDPKGDITDVNDYAAEIFGYAKEELIAHSVFGTIFPLMSNEKGKPNIIERIFTNPKLYIEYETESIRKNGEHFWVSWTNRVMYDDAGQAIELRAVGFDITKRKQLEEELRYMASVDPLTGALNRQALLEAGMHELKRAQRYKRDMAVMVMKLDYFHEANDNHGFSDEIIRQAVQIARGITRDSDFIGRVGDVEFALILPETSDENAQIVADRIKEKIQEENLKYQGNYFVTVNFGIVAKKTLSDTIDSLLLAALNKAQDKVLPSVQKQSKKRKKGA